MRAGLVFLAVWLLQFILWNLYRKICWILKVKCYFFLFFDSAGTIDEYTTSLPTFVFSLNLFRAFNTPDCSKTSSLAVARPAVRWLPNKLKVRSDAALQRQRWLVCIDITAQLWIKWAMYFYVSTRIRVSLWLGFWEVFERRLSNNLRILENFEVFSKFWLKILKIKQIFDLKSQI